MLICVSISVDDQDKYLAHKIPRNSLDAIVVVLILLIVLMAEHMQTVLFYVTPYWPYRPEGMEDVAEFIHRGFFFIVRLFFSQS